MRKPLAIDLFCGLIEAKLSHCANASIKQFVACRAENPNHVALTILHLAACIHTPVFRSMSNLQHSIFPARFAGSGQIRILPVQPFKNCSSSCSPSVVDLLDVRFSGMKRASLPLARFLSAFIGAVPSIGSWRNYLEVLIADGTVSSRCSRIGLFKPSAPTFA